MSIFGLLANLLALTVLQYAPQFVEPALCLPFAAPSMELQIILGFLIIVPLAALGLLMDWVTASTWNFQIFLFVLFTGC